MRWLRVIEDPISELKLSKVYPDIADLWRKARAQFWELYDLQLKVTQGYRTYADQWKIYAQGRTKNAAGIWVISDKSKIVTNAVPGESFHNFGLAVDSAFMGDHPYLSHMSQVDRTFLWNEFGRIAELVGLEWGGNWKMPDRPHCQKTYGLKLSQIRSEYEKRGCVGVFEKCRQVMHCGEETVL